MTLSLSTTMQKQESIYQNGVGVGTNRYKENNRYLSQVEINECCGITKIRIIYKSRTGIIFHRVIISVA